MEVGGTLQLERMSLAGDRELSSSSSSPPPPNSDSLPFFSSLPPELLIHIFESLSTHPDDERAANLSSLCLVNHHFLEIARPLLYRQVHLDFSQDYDKPWSAIRQLFRTLLKVEHCSILVKSIRISMDQTTALEVTAIAYLLSQLQSLESVQTGFTEDGEDDFMDAIRKHQPGLKHLELRGVTFEWSHHWRMLNALEDLEVLVGQFDSLENVEPASHQSNLACELRRFVSHSSITTSTFERILHSSSESHTSLAFTINPEHADFDLSRFKNLKSLRIALEDDTNMTLDLYDYELNQHYRTRAIREAPSSKFATQLRSILESTLALPVETLSITVEEDYIAEIMSSQSFLRLLPCSLRHFGTVFEFLELDAANHQELAVALRRGRLLNLAKITIFPSSGVSDSYSLLPSSTTRRMYNEVEKELGIPITSHRPSPGLITQWFTLEPYLEETDEEEEDEETEEDCGSEEEDEFRSDSEEEDVEEDSEGSDGE
ncbi:hypothetical protein JCM5353_008114 [Sporobolomyces roseus]